MSRVYRMSLFVLLLSAPAASWGRDLCDLLKDKGILATDAEYEECKAASNAKPAGEAAAAPQPAKTEEAKALNLPDWLNRLSFFGDVRVRHEGFYQNDEKARNRERIRLRLGANVTVSDEVEGGLRLASGNQDDPISTNQTLSDAFTRKPINLDWAYITLRPGKTLGLDRPWVTLTGGKFGNPVFRPKAIMGSELVFDDDFSPEGFHETLLAFESEDGILRTAQLQALQWAAAEQSKGTDAWVFGGQGAVDLAPFARTGLSLGFANYYFREADLIARERNDNDDLVMTNSVVLKDGTVRGGVDFDPSSGNPIVEYRGGFNVINPSLQVKIDTGLPDWPVALFADLAHNTEAKGGDDTGVSVGAGIGGAKKPGQWGFSAMYYYVETDAVPSTFSYSDLGRGGTNVQGPIVKVDYMPFPHLTLTAKNHFVSYIDRPADESNSMLFRMQLDATLAF